MSVTRPLGERIRRAFTEITGWAPIAPAGARGGPAAAAARAGRIQRRSLFRGAEASRLLADFVGSVMAPDREIHGDLRTLRARARDLRRNNPFIRQYVNLLKANVLGPHGPKLQAQVRDRNGELLEQVNDTIEAAWSRYWSGPVTTDGTLTGNELSQLALETVAGDGEAFVRLIEDAELNAFGLSMQMIDADLVDDSRNQSPSPGAREVRLGVEIDTWGRPTGYWILEQQGYTPGDPRRSALSYRMDAGELLHLYRPLRPNQSRGVTWFAPAMVAIQQLNGYTEAELVAARTAAAKMGFIVQKDTSMASAPADEGTGEGPTPLELEANPGSIEELPPGSEFQDWDPTHPSTAFPDFTKSILRQIATGLGVSYNALANDLENVNYSSMRSGLLIERDLWQMIQSWWEGYFLTPIYHRWLNMALLTGQLQLAERDWRRYTEVRWQGRGWPWVDPKNDAEAGELALALGLTSRKRLLAEVGADYSEIVEELADEQRQAKQVGVSIDRSSPASSPPAKASGAGDDSDDSDDDEAPAGRAAALPNGIRSRLASATSANGHH